MSSRLADCVLGRARRDQPNRRDPVDVGIHGTLDFFAKHVGVDLVIRPLAAAGRQQWRHVLDEGIGTLDHGDTGVEQQLTAWREAFCATPDPQPARSAQEMRESKAELKTLQGKHEVLQRELRRKERALAEAAALLVLQKKFQALLGDED